MERAALVKWKYFFFLGGRSPNLHVILSDPERKVEFCCILCRYLARSFLPTCSVVHCPLADFFRFFVSHPRGGGWLGWWKPASIDTDMCRSKKIGEQFLCSSFFFFTRETKKSEGSIESCFLEWPFPTRETFPWLFIFERRERGRRKMRIITNKIREESSSVGTWRTRIDGNECPMLAEVGGSFVNEAADSWHVTHSQIKVKQQVEKKVRCTSCWLVIR